MYVLDLFEFVNGSLGYFSHKYDRFISLHEKLYIVDFFMSCSISIFYSLSPPSATSHSCDQDETNR